MADDESKQLAAVKGLYTTNIGTKIKISCTELYACANSQ